VQFQIQKPHFLKKEKASTFETTTKKNYAESAGEVSNLRN
jgi:hypothetical protein